MTRRAAGVVLFLLLGSGPLFAVDRVRLDLQVASDGTPRAGRLPLDILARIETGWHINGNKPRQPFLIPTVLTFTLPPGIAADAIHYPQPEEKTFAFAGGEKLLVYEGKLGLSTALIVPGDFPGGRVRVEAALRYQACNDSTCLPPATARAELVVPVAAAVGGTGQVIELTTGWRQRAGLVSEGEWRVDEWLRERGLFLTLLAVAILGIGLNLTPCVYPLISVTISYFGGQARGRGATALLAIVYVVGIALSFSAFGLVAAMSGGLFGAALQKPAVILFIAAVLLTLALSSFGVYQFRVPAVLTRWAGGAQRGALGALFMGLTMGIVAAPCVGPVVVGLLVFVGSRQDPYLGLVLFFVLALGMGAPYIVLAVAAGSIRRLPRSGEWLMWTERLFGCLLLSLAVYFLAPLTPPAVRPYLLPIAIGLSGVYLGFLNSAGRSIRHFPALRRSVGATLIAFAVWLGQPAGSEQGIAWVSATSLPQDGDRQELDRPLLVDFSADWCIPCREMESTTYVHPGVLREAERFHMVKVDITNENDETSKVVERYRVRGVPTIIVFSRHGDERQRLVGYVGPDEMLAAMRAVE